MFEIFIKPFGWKYCFRKCHKHEYYKHKIVKNTGTCLTKKIILPSGTSTTLKESCFTY